MATLENSSIVILSRNTELVKAFPVLSRAASPGVRASGCCGGSRSAIDFNAIKASIARMGPEARERFKRMTGWKNVLVVYRDGSGVKRVTL